MRARTFGFSLILAGALALVASVPAYAQRSVQQTFFLDASGECGQIDVTGLGTAGVQVEGSHGGTLTWTVSQRGVTYTAIDLFAPDTPSTAANTTTSTGQWTGPVAGLAIFRVCLSGSPTGTAIVTLTAAGTGGGGGGGGGGGTNSAASATGSAVPSDAGYTGINVGGTLRGITGLGVGSHFAGAVAIVDSSGNQISSFGGSGGTSVNEDVASANADPGTPAYTVRNNTLTGATGADGDYQPTKSTAAGAIYIAPTFGDTVASTGNGASGAQTQRVTIANDSTGVLATVSTVTTVSTLTTLSQLGGVAVPVEDAAETAAGTGIYAMSVRRDTAASSAGTTGDNATINTDATGRLWTRPTGAVTPADNFSVPTDAITVWAINGCYDGTTVDLCRASTLTEATEDSAETAGGVGTYAMGVRRDTAASSAGTTGDNATLNTDANGLLWTRRMDPCTALNPTTVPISVAADTAVISAGGASTRTYICGGALVAAAAEIVNIWEGTGTACGTSSAALAGSTTEANGMSLAANGGFIIPQTIRGIGTNVDVCIRLSSTNRVAGWLSYVQVAQ